MERLQRGKSRRPVFGNGRRNWGPALVVLCLWLSGCEDRSPRLSDGVIRVGAIYPLSGSTAATGEDLRNGVELALELVNRAAPLRLPMARRAGLSWKGGVRLEVVYRDSRGDPAVAAEQVRTLVHDEGVVALMGCYNSTVTAAAGEAAEMLGVPFLNAASTAPLLTERGLKWFFRTTPDDEIFARNFFAFLTELEEHGSSAVPRRLILVHENRLWGTGVALAERKMARQYGFEVGGVVSYDARRDRFDAELAAVHRDSREDCIIMQTSYVDDAIRFMQGYKRRGVRPVALLAMNGGFISPRFLQVLGEDGEYVLSREVWALDLGRVKPQVNAVNGLFRDRFGRNMTGNSARAFTALTVLAEALERAGSPAPDRIRAALLQTELGAEELIMPWEGVAFDPSTGQNRLGSGIIVQVQDGEYVTVWPTELAAAEVVWPMPPWRDGRQVRP